MYIVKSKEGCVHRSRFWYWNWDANLDLDSKTKKGGYKDLEELTNRSHWLITDLIVESIEKISKERSVYYS